MTEEQSPERDQVANRLAVVMIFRQLHEGNWFFKFTNRKGCRTGFFEVDIQRNRMTFRDVW